jgi:hypothetical protein
MGPPKLSPVGLRIGDQERQQAVLLLGKHWGAGRLDAEEFDERTKAVLRARTGGELALVFQDLPYYVAPAPPSVSAVTKLRAVPVLALVGGAVVAGAGVLAVVTAAAGPSLACH